MDDGSYPTATDWHDQQRIAQETQRSLSEWHVNNCGSRGRKAPAHGEAMPEGEKNVLQVETFNIGNRPMIRGVNMPDPDGTPAKRSKNEGGHDSHAVHWCG